MDFFTPNCRYFKFEYFQEWQRLRALASKRGKYNVKKVGKKPAKAAVAVFDPSKHYNKEQLAKICGYKNGDILSTVVTTLKGKNQEFSDVAQDCFMRVKNPQTKKIMVAFKIEKLDEFKKFLPHIVEQNAKHNIDPEKEISIADLAKKMELSVIALQNRMNGFLRTASSEQKADFESWFVSSDSRRNYKSALKAEYFDKFVEMFGGERKRGRPKRVTTQSNSVDTIVQENDDKKTMTLVDVVALDKLVKRWIDILSDLYEQQDMAEKRYDAAMAKVAKAKSAAERSVLINQMQSANEDIMSVAARVREIQTKIDAAHKLARERHEAIEALNAAEKALAEKDAKIAEFIRNANQK